MNEEDLRMQGTERDASPERWPAGQQQTHAHSTEEVEEPLEKSEKTYLARQMTSSSTSRESINPPERRSTAMSRMTTQQDVGQLERHPTALSRIQTGRSQHSHTIATGIRSRTSTRQSRKPMPNFGGGKPFPPDLPEREEYVVEFDGPDDPLHAQNWPLKKKLVVSIVLGFVTLCASFGSSIFSTAIEPVAEHFGVGREVGVLGVSLYVLGFATGPLLWAPASELYGRKWPIIISSFAFSIFSLAVAVAKDVQTVFICRFFGGFTGACPLAVVGAAFADMYNNSQRGLAITVFSMTVFAGPLLAPFIGGFIVMSIGWRWTEYITCIMGFLGLGLSLVFLEETYPPVILVAKAADLRRRTKNWGIHAKQEEIEVDFRELVEKNLSRPLRMLISEPIVLALSIYMAFVYGLLYLFLSFYPIVFQGVYGMNPGVGGLPFIGMILGELLSGFAIVLMQSSYNRKLAANNNIPVPEWRLPIVIVGGVLFAIGLLWFGWTGYRSDIPWIAPTLSGLFTGFGIMSIFLQCLNYIIDSYLMFAASAIAANTLLRSLAGAGFPLFAEYMITGLGVQWAGTLLGCVGFLLVPLPILFYKYGPKLRERSTFAPTFGMANSAHAPVTGDEEDKGEA